MTIKNVILRDPVLVERLLDTLEVMIDPDTACHIVGRGEQEKHTAIVEALQEENRGHLVTIRKLQRELEQQKALTAAAAAWSSKQLRTEAGKVLGIIPGFAPEPKPLEAMREDEDIHASRLGYSQREPVAYHRVGHTDGLGGGSRTNDGYGFTGAGTEVKQVEEWNAETPGEPSGELVF